jgi:hypothetical protein
LQGEWAKSALAALLRSKSADIRDWSCRADRLAEQAKLARDDHFPHIVNNSVQTAPRQGCVLFELSPLADLIIR